MIENNKNEIPFGAKDSELCGFEYTIPDGFEAEIKDGKVIIRKKESEDEKIRKEIIDHVRGIRNVTESGAERTMKWLAYLEKQGEHYNFRKKIQVGDHVTRNKDGVLVNLSQLKRVAKPADVVEPEKQGEQKPADKVEPKFKVGDTISKKHNSDINKFGIFTITSISDNKYWYNDSVICDFSDQDLWEFVERTKFKKGDWVFHNTAEFIYMIQTIGRDGYGVISRDGKKSVVHYSAEINYRLWTIQDAKDGDVLATKDSVFIFKYMDKAGLSLCKSYCEVIGNSLLANILAFFSIVILSPVRIDSSTVKL